MLDVVGIVCVMVLTRFQLASTAFTVTVTAEPADCAVGDPVLPLPVSGAAASPGIYTLSLHDALPILVVALPVFDVSGPALVSLAVTVCDAAVLNVTE